MNNDLSLFKVTIVYKSVPRLPHFNALFSILQSIVLMVMYAEALTVAIRQQNHIRITRLLRPLFLLDTHYMIEVRR